MSNPSNHHLRGYVVSAERCTPLKMKIELTILILIFSVSCDNPNEIKNSNGKEALQELSSNEFDKCFYIDEFEDLGNRIVDTIRVKQRLIDPIDDFDNFEKADLKFVKRENKIYRKSKTHRYCGSKHVDVEYYQDFTNRIELNSYREYDGTYFTTKNKVNFWWVNSDGYLIIPINNADPKTFKPFQDLCGGIDKKGIFYGCPNRGVFQLNIPVSSDFEFVPKENNYWNSPNHYVIVNNRVFDIRYELEKGYFCELDKTVSVSEILKMKK